MDEALYEPRQPVDKPLTEVECKVLNAFGMTETPCIVRNFDAEWTKGLVQLMVDAAGSKSLLAYRVRLATAFPEFAAAVSAFLEGNLIERYEYQKQHPVCAVAVELDTPKKRLRKG